MVVDERDHRVPRAREVFLDPRGDDRSLRVTWHQEAQLVVLSLWRDNVCAGTFRLRRANATQEGRVSYFTAVVAREGRTWVSHDLDVDSVEDLDELTAEVRGVVDDEDLALVLVEREDVWWAVVRLDGEYYLSLTYKSVLDMGLTVGVYELQHFMQWGTPQDLEEYRATVANVPY